MRDRQYDTYVMENILFKISFPAEFHAQTAVEAAILLHPVVDEKFSMIERIEIETQQSAVRIIDKIGPLHNPADRDHCLQYMVAIGLLHGQLTADHYEDSNASDERIEQLREKMVVKENPQFTTDYLDADKRSIGNSIQLFFQDGTCSDKVAIEYPVGHRQRRQEGIPLLIEKFKNNLNQHFNVNQAEPIIELLEQPDKLHQLAADDFIDLFINSSPSLRA